MLVPLTPKKKEQVDVLESVRDYVSGRLNPEQLQESLRKKNFNMKPVTPPLTSHKFLYQTPRSWPS